MIGQGDDRNIMRSLFDRMLEEYCDGAEDAEIDLLSETRSGRAFRLLGQAAGTFD